MTFIWGMSRILQCCLYSHQCFDMLINQLKKTISKDLYSPSNFMMNLQNTPSLQLQSLMTILWLKYLNMQFGRSIPKFVWVSSGTNDKVIIIHVEGRALTSQFYINYILICKHILLINLIQLLKTDCQSVLFHPKNCATLLSYTNHTTNFTIHISLYNHYHPIESRTKDTRPTAYT